MSAKQEIYDYLIGKMRSGDIKAGERLATEKEIAAQFNVSRSTTQAVMARLLHEGCVKRYAGRGTFACRLDEGKATRVNLDIHNIQSFENEMAIVGDSVSYQFLSFCKIPAPTYAAQKLGIEEGSLVYTLNRLRLVDGKCIGSEMRYFSPNIHLDVSAQALEKDGVHILLEDVLNISIGRIDAALRAVNASEVEAEKMSIEQNAPLLVRSHILYDTDDKVILYGESFYVEPFSFRYSANVRS